MTRYRVQQDPDGDPHRQDAPCIPSSHSVSPTGDCTRSKDVLSRDADHKIDEKRKGNSTFLKLPLDLNRNLISAPKLSFAERILCAIAASLFLSGAVWIVYQLVESHP